MRSLLAVAVAGAVIASLSAAQAENRIFVLASNSDGYGIDHCLATGARCGTAAATAFCQGREFAQASSFGKVDRDEITGAGSQLRGRLPSRFVRRLHRDRMHPVAQRCRSDY